MATDVKEGQVRSDLDQLTFPKISSCIGLVALKSGSGKGNRVLLGAHFYDPTQEGEAQYRPKAMWQKINVENRLNRMGRVTRIWCVGSLYTWTESPRVTYSWPTDFIRSIITEFGDVEMFSWDSGAIGNGSYDIRVSLRTNDTVSVSYKPSADAGPWTSVNAAHLRDMSATLHGFLAYVA